VCRRYPDIHDAVIRAVRLRRGYQVVSGQRHGLGGPWGLLDALVHAELDFMFYYSLLFRRLPHVWVWPVDTAESYQRYTLMCTHPALADKSVSIEPLHRYFNIVETLHSKRGAVFSGHSDSAPTNGPGCSQVNQREQEIWGHSW